MESAKRKREADGAVRERREATDAEVEEFYAILRRIRDASRCPAAAAAPPPDAVRGREVRWRPAFAWEDFAVRDAAAAAPLKITAAPLKITAAETEGEGESAGPPRRIDLNADPEPESGSTPGEVTARC